MNAVTSRFSLAAEHLSEFIATPSPLALAHAFLADVATCELLPGNEDLSRHLSQVAADLDFADLAAVLTTLGQALRVASAPPTLAKGRGALARHLDAVAQRQRLGMLVQVARVLAFDAMKGGKA